MSAEEPTPTPTVSFVPSLRNQARRPVPSSSNNLAESHRDAERDDPPLVLIDPYEGNTTLMDNGDFIRDPFVVRDLETGQATPGTRRPSTQWLKYILKPTRLIFSWLQLGLSSMYFRRVAAIIQNSGISAADFDLIHRHTNTQRSFLKITKFLGGPSMPEANSVQRFEEGWEALMKWCMGEWSNSNVVSGLLLGVLLTFLQIDEAGLHPITRLAALLSLVCAYWSLFFGVLYIGRFRSLEGLKGGMSLITVAAIQRHTLPHWNMWVFLALPAIWQGWSLVLFLASILSFIWTSGDRGFPALTPYEDEATGLLPMSFNQFVPLWPRVILTVVFIIGMATGLLVQKTFSDIGAKMLKRRGLESGG